MKTALVCIARDEDNYIDEWINYNLKIVFDKIFVFANEMDFHNHNHNEIEDTAARDFYFSPAPTDKN